MKQGRPHQIEYSRQDRIKTRAGGRCYFVNSEDIEYDIKRIRREKISEIQLTPETGYKLCHFDWIDQISDQITSLNIGPRSDAVFDYSAVSKCRKLKSLYCNNNAKSDIDITRNKSITNAVFLNMKRVHGVHELLALESLTMYKPRSDMLDKEFYNKLESLVSLSIRDAALSDGFFFLEETNVECLDLYSCNPLSATGLDKLRLRELTIERCKEMIDISALHRCWHLEKLSIVDSFCLESIQPFIGMPMLQELIVLGRSFFTDGRLDVAMGRFEYLGIDNKRHYSKKFEDFQRKEK